MTSAFTGKAKAVWTLADQLVASSTNALLSILVARSVTAFAFGSFALAFLVFSFLVGIVRALVTDPLLIRHGSDSPAALRLASAKAAGASAVLGVVGAAGCALGWVLTDGPTSSSLAALAVVLPGLLVQDAWRRAFFAARRPAAAFVNDVIWSLLQLGGVIVLTRSGTPAVGMLLLVWGLSGLVAAAVGARQIGHLPMPLRGIRWCWDQRALGVRLGLDFLVSQGAFSVAMVLVSATAGVAVVGALRAGQVLLGPVQVLLLALTSFVLPLFVRLAADLPAFRRLLRWTAVTAGACTALWVVPLLVLPDSLGTRLMGASWDGAQGVLPGLGVQTLLVALATGPALALRALGRASTLLRLSLIQAPVLLVGTVAGALWWGAPGAAGGLVLAHTVGTLLNWRCARAATRTEDGEATVTAGRLTQSAPGSAA